MNVIHIVLGKANPNRMNGVNKVAHNLATCQMYLGHNVEIFGLSNSPQMDAVDRNYVLRIFKKRHIGLDKNLKKKILLYDNLNTIFHIHGGFIIDFFFLAIMLKKYEFKYIFTSHGSYNKEALKKGLWKKKIFFWFFDKYILKNSWKSQFLGKSEFDHIDCLLKGIPKILIPNGHILEECKPFKRGELDNQPVFGFVGRIDLYHKGLDILLPGFLSYKNKGGKGILYIIGDGPDLPWLKKYIIDNNLIEYVILFGAQFGDEKLKLFSQLDVFVHTSRFEGFPMAVLEAAGIKKPLLISQETNFAEYVWRYNSGIVLKANISTEVVKELFNFERMFFNTGLLTFSENSYEMVKNEFNWRRIAQHLLEDGEYNYIVTKRV